ncbi:MAG: hypothetical protein EPN88_02040 [Bacteroidetes bacterium]|nr:MAG: hypothetical protein EPN88_02040 [Bacteroidota bacterium]
MPTKEFLEGKQQITLYPTEAQHKKLKDLAKKRGKNLSTYILDSAFRDEKIHEKLDKIIGMLGNKTEIEMELPTPEEIRERIKELSSASGAVLDKKSTIPELKQKVKEMEGKPQMVEYRGKGGK